MACSHEVAGILQRSTSPSLFSPGAREACDEAASTAGTSSGGKNRRPMRSSKNSEVKPISQVAQPREMIFALGWMMPCENCYSYIGMDIL